MKDFINFLIAQWYYVIAILAVIYLLLQDDNTQDDTADALSPQSLTYKINNENIMIYDLRDESSYTKGHIEGSKRLRLTADMSSVNKIMKLNKAVVFVCQDGSVSAKIAKRLKSARSEPTYLLKGGMQAWQSELFPVTVDVEFTDDK